MNSFSFGEKFRLELHWDKVIYEKEGICRFVNSYFSGPVISQAQKLKPNDNILLDFFEQYFNLVRSVYVAKLSWGDVIYNNNGTITLKDTFLIHELELNNVPVLKDNDYLIIDTSGHEVEKHPFNPVYKTYTVNSDTNLYNFRG